MNQQITEYFDAQYRQVKDAEWYYRTHETTIEFVVAELQRALGEGFLDYKACIRDINIKVTGDYDTFKTMMTVLYNLDYRPQDKPKSTKFTEFSTWWKNHTDPEDHPKFWVWFASTVCTRQTTGRKETVEIDVYEIVCSSDETTS